MTEQQDKQTAAIKLQACARGYLARKLYAERLFERYKTEEDERRGREREILTARHRLEIGKEIAICENKERRLNLMAIRIQRAWKAYRVTRGPQKSIPGEDRAVCSHCELEMETDHSLPDRLQGRATSQCYSSGSEEVHHVSAEERVGQLEKQVRLAFGKSEIEQLEFSDEMSEHTRTQLPMAKRGLGVTSMTEVPLEEQTKLAETGLGIASNPPCNSNQESTSLNTEKKTCTKNVRHSQDRTSVSPIYSGNSKPESTVSDMYRLSYALELTDSSSEEEMDDTKLVSIFNGKPKPTIEPIVHTLTGGSFASLESNFEGGLYTTGSHADFHLECKWQNDEKHKSRRSTENPQPLQSTVVDHRASPLYAMSLDQLRALLDSVEKKMKSMSQSLIQLLEERELLTAENEILKANVARMTRKLQDLHQR